MYHFYGILDRSPDPHEGDHRHSIAKISKQFPLRAAAFEIIERDSLYLFGTPIRSARLGKTELFFIGEIYNESELKSGANANATLETIILEQFLRHGEGSLQKLNGSFVIIVFEHDVARCRIFNDQMGALQLFYHADRNFILFASELKFLFCHPRCPRKIDWTSSLKRHIPFLIVNAERIYNAWFTDIKLLEEGSELTLNSSGMPVHKTYWDPWNEDLNEHDSTRVQSEEQQLAMYESAYMDLLEDAVKLRISSPNSAYSMFSGGMDSTVIAALARKYGEIGTFSFATQATVKDGATEMAIRLADDLGMANTQIVVPFDELVRNGQLWAKHIWSMESPIAHKDAIGKMAMHAAISMVQPEVHHILSGSGSDQLNGGLVRWFVKDAEDGAHDANWKRAITEMQTEMLKPVIGHQYDTFWGSRDLLRQDYLSSLSATPLDNCPWSNFVRGCLHANQFILIWDELRTANWHQRGVRFPFMDYRFIPFVLGVPRALHGRLFFDKQILRRAGERIFPSYLTQRPKAPVIKPGEDQRMKTYASILLGDKERILDQIMEALRPNDLPIDRNLFESKVRQLVDEPDPAGWAYLMHVAGLIMLDSLPDQDENTMDMHPDIMPHVDVVKATSPGAMQVIRKKLAVLTQEEIMLLPISFGSGCSLVSDVFTNIHFLVKDGEMCYELDDEFPAWKTFLRSIDNERSANAICEAEGLDLSLLQDFLKTSLEEGILYTVNPTLQHAAT